MKGTISLVLLIMLAANASLVSLADDDSPNLEHAPSDSRWWNDAVRAAYAAVATVPKAIKAPSLEEMSKVERALASRLNNLKARIGWARVSELADRGISLTIEDLYAKIPLGVRLAGEGPSTEFLDGRDLSHIESVNQFPEKALDRDNVLFEERSANRARGAAAMTATEVAVTWVRNLPASVGGARVLMLSASKGLGIGALVEVPVTAAVETLQVVNQGKEVEVAAWDALQALGVTGAVGAAATGALTLASAYGFTLGAPIIIPVAVIGGSAYVWISGERVWEALDDRTRGEVQAQLAEIQSNLRELAGRVGVDYGEGDDQG